MEEEIIIGDNTPDEEEDREEWIQKKMNKLRNLKHFREWPEDRLRDWVTLRHGEKEPLKKLPSLEDTDVPVPASVPEEAAQTIADVNSDEYKKKFNTLLNKYRKEFAVDMNESNDAESLRAYVRYTIQLEQTDDIIRSELASKIPDHRILKGLGDFQRSLQMNQNEIQDKLGISRKQRKEKVVDDIPQYIKGLQDKAKDFWNRKTVPVKCDKCKIELARIWLNFPDLLTQLRYEGRCEKCKQEVVHII